MADLKSIFKHPQACKLQSLAASRSEKLSQSLLEWSSADDPQMSKKKQWLTGGWVDSSSSPLPRSLEEQVQKLLSGDGQKQLSEGLEHDRGIAFRALGQVHRNSKVLIFKQDHLLGLGVKSVESKYKLTLSDLEELLGPVESSSVLEEIWLQNQDIFTSSESWVLGTNTIRAVKSVFAFNARILAPELTLVMHAIAATSPSRLQKLDLRNNHIFNATGSHLLADIIRSAPSLKELGVGPFEDETGAKVIGEAVARHKSLETLFLQRGWFEEDEPVKGDQLIPTDLFLAAALTGDLGNKSIQYLYYSFLSRSNSEFRLGVLPPILAVANISKLSLACAHTAYSIPSYDWRSLFQYSLVSPSVQCLDLPNYISICKPGGIGLDTCAFAELLMLLTSHRLQELTLRVQRGEGVDWALFYQALECNYTISTLRLHVDVLPRNAKENFIEWIRGTPLRHLELHGPFRWHSVFEALSSNMRIRRTYLFGTEDRLDKHAFERLMQLVRESRIRDIHVNGLTSHQTALLDQSLKRRDVMSAWDRLLDQFEELVAYGLYGVLTDEECYRADLAAKLINDYRLRAYCTSGSSADSGGARNMSTLIRKLKADLVVTGLASSISSSILQERHRDPRFITDSSGHFGVTSDSICIENGKKKKLEPPTSTVKRLLDHVDTTSQSTQPSIRSDVLQLGYTRLDDDFDISRMVCIFKQDLEAIEVIFLHPEGMASVLGVGLPFSQVRIGVQNVVEVKELNERAWTEFWMESHRHHYTLLQLNLVNFIDIVTPPLPGLLHLSSTQAAEIYAVGIQGTESFSVSEARYQQGSFNSFWFCDILRNKILKPEQPLSTGTSGSNPLGAPKTSRRGDEVGATKGGLKGRKSRSMSWETTGSINVGISESTIINRSTDGEPSNLERDINIGARNQHTMRSEHKQQKLTVRVLLNPDSYIFYSPYENLALQRKEETGRDGFVRFIHPSQKGGSEDAMRECKMEAELTFQFLCYDPDNCGLGVKRSMRTRVEVHYNMDGGSDGYNTSAGDGKEFGWYHDKLRVAFKCAERNAARLEKGVSLDKEYEGTLIGRSANRQISTERSVSTVLGRGMEAKLDLGHKKLPTVDVGTTSKRERAEEGTCSRESSNSISARCMEDLDFSISIVSKDKQEMAYQANIFPPLAYSDLWASGARNQAVSTGIMSTVSMAFKGDWIIKELRRTESSPSCSRKGLGLCNYEFSCQRDLKRHKRSLLVSRKNVQSTFKRLNRLWIKVLGGNEECEEVESTLVVQQKIQKGLLINHNFF